MLVRLWKLDFAAARMKEDEMAEKHGVRITRLLSPNFKKAEEFVRAEFGDGWASEMTASFYSDPVSCHIAVKDRQIVGFACYNATGKGFFGPTGVKESLRGQGVGTALLFRSLASLWEEGYAYAVIGSAGPKDYYAKTVGATLIEDSEPGIYSRMV